MVSDGVRNFVLPVGSTIYMDGTALYFPVATIWLATTQGLEIGAVDYILIVILSPLGSAGTAPVPSASLVFIVTTFNTVFGTTGTPEYFYIMMAIDWLLDRFRTLVNVTGDTLVARMVEVRAGGDCGNIQNKDSDSDTPADDETSLRENSLDMQYV
jgi:Na+/H+-dicarboxylate symporter